MWEAYGLDDEGILWAGIAFNGGIGGQNSAPCGAISAATIALGLRHRCPMDDKQKTKQERLNAREDASQLVKNFIEKFGSIICRDLLKLDFTKPEQLRYFQESGISKEKCDKYVQFVLEKLFELDENRNITREPQTTLLYTRPGCNFCAAARKDLEERGVNYKEISIEDNPEALEIVKRLSNGLGTVPIIVNGNEVKVGFGGA
ncbi:MAG: Uxx-star family glutaredoxin-like (seleno)protein [Dehalococcoidales bacterium]|nr:Uxx-star family glutaredoxin-like (seleno)protein [Dehalococcoidales bacterium]